MCPVRYRMCEIPSGNSLLYLLGNAAHSSVEWFAHLCGVDAVQFSTATAPGPSEECLIWRYIPLAKVGISKKDMERPLGMNEKLARYSVRVSS